MNTANAENRQFPHHCPVGKDPRHVLPAQMITGFEPCLLLLLQDPVLSFLFSILCSPEDEASALPLPDACSSIYPPMHAPPRALFQVRVLPEHTQTHTLDRQAFPQETHFPDT